MRDHGLCKIIRKVVSFCGVQPIRLPRGRIYHDPDSVRNTVAHELGHILCLERHTNNTHLMYGSEHQVDPFETHGYVVPEQLEEQFVGEVELHDRLQMMDDELDDMDAKLVTLEARGDLVGDTL